MALGYKYKIAFWFMTLTLSFATIAEAKKFAPPKALGGPKVVEPVEALVPIASEESITEESATAVLQKEMEIGEPASTIVSAIGNTGRENTPEDQTPLTTVEISKVTAAESTLSEDKIPVLKEKEKPAEAVAGGSMHKVVISFTLILLLISALAFGLKRTFQKKGIANKHTNIRVVTQHYLGAKKSLAIVTVAGEYILLGVTDQNINLIKTLTLMDDEIPESAAKTFNAALQTADARPDFVEVDDKFSIRNLKESVSQKLRGMKEFS